MSCFSCFSLDKKKVAKRPNSGKRIQQPANRSQMEAIQPSQPRPDNHNGNNSTATQTFTLRELAAITNKFSQECLIGEGGFGRVYKGRLKETNQEVAVKKLDRNGLQGNREFLVEVLMLGILQHQNIVNLIGYCADGDQRLLVFEYLPLGSLEDHLLNLHQLQKPLDWFTRMKIALDAAEGLAYLHNKANPPVIYRNLKPSNILLDKDFIAKLSDFGLAKLGPTGDKSYISTRVVGTHGYCAPEYQRTGLLTVKSDVYSFGVVLLELITGRRAIDNTRQTQEQNLVFWVYPVFKDPQRYTELADPLLQGNFPMTSLHQAVEVAAMCLNEEPSVRPLISEVVTALSFLGTNSASQDLAGIAPIDISSPLQEDNSAMELQRNVSKPLNKAPLHESSSSF